MQHHEEYRSLVIKYLGSKRTLIPTILETIRPLPVRSVLDLFSGTSRVGYALKKAGYDVTSNDYNRYAETIARCYIEGDRDKHDIKDLISELQQVETVDHWFADLYSKESRFFQPENARKIAGIRERIETLNLDPVMKAIALTSLLEAADRVDSTVGLQMAYLKSWAPRAFKPLELRVPDLLSGSGRVFRRDALELIRELPKVDLAYLDPPYNQHSYLGNYHVWETLVSWDRPAVYGKAMKRDECGERKSSFNSKRSFEASFREMLSVKASYVLLSFSDEGFLPIEKVLTLCREVGEVSAQSQDFKRHVGAQIGIHGLDGSKVGSVSHLRNKEFLILIHKD